MKASALPNAVFCAVLIAVVAIVYWPTSAALWSYWIDPDSPGNHGPLIALISVWLLYRGRRELNETALKPVVWLAIPLILMSLAWLVFWRAHIPALHIILFPALILLGIAAALGWKAARWALFPIGFLYFAVPSWDVLVAPLQALTVVVIGAVAP
jgi:exosortase